MAEQTDKVKGKEAIGKHTDDEKLVTDGITERRTQDGGRFGIEGIRRALAEVENPTAAATAMRILQAVTDCWHEPLEDDGTSSSCASPSNSRPGFGQALRRRAHTGERAYADHLITPEERLQIAMARQ